MPLAPGDRVGPYEVLSLIGEGAMGEVWKARDTRLGRTVALKCLKNACTARFQQEARALAALSHPHICQIYDVGPDYLVLEFVDGAPLKGPLPVAQALPLALQIARALEAAHRRGILHRDLKPANVMVTETGAKLLDFGLAKIAADSDVSATQTTEGTIVGTAAYMAPEQATGQPLDARSDIFSFGAVLYEMLSGRRAFAGESFAAVLSAVLRDDPAPVEASADFQRIMARCLAKRPQDRFSAMSEVCAMLEQMADRPHDGQPSIAVLPFANMSRDPDDEYFSDGLAEEILNLLAKIPGLKVTARTSSFAFRGKEQDITRIAAALHVSTILEGSVRRAGNRVRVAAQLIDAADGYHIWSDRYDREMMDVFAMQDEIAGAIVAALKLRLASAPAPERRRQPKLPAYEAFLKGRHQLVKNSSDSLARAKTYFEQAIELDPDFAAAHGELATYYLVSCGAGLRAPREALLTARDEARRALELDPAEARAHTALCGVASFHDYDGRLAEEHFRLSLASDSVAPEIRLRGVLYYLLPRARFQEAVRQFETALDQDPLSVPVRSYFSLALACAGEYERALAEVGKAAEIDDQLWIAHFPACLAYIGLERFPEALEAGERTLRLASWHPFSTGTMAALLTRSGQSGRAENLLAQPNVRLGLGMVMYHVLCGDWDAALDAYAAAIDRREPQAVMFASASFFQPLREHPRWPALAETMRLPAPR